MAERLLIIDDDARLAAMVSDYLAGAGYGVERAFTGRDGLAAFERGTFEAVILDVNDRRDANDTTIAAQVKGCTKLPCTRIAAEATAASAANTRM